jgi:hypothetical protein
MAPIATTAEWRYARLDCRSEVRGTLAQVDQEANRGRRVTSLDEWSQEPNLDFIRAFAVLCVVLRHIASALAIPSTPWFQPQALGIFGVLLFFVHTSLVLMLSLDRQQHRRVTPAWRFYCSFLVRRFFRIYPLRRRAQIILPRAVLGSSGIAEALNQRVE